MDLEAVEEIKRHFSVVAEGLRSDVRLVIEGVGANTERLDRVDARLDRVEVRLDRIEVRLDSVETKLGGMQTEFTGLKTMIRPLIPRTDR